MPDFVASNPGSNLGHLDFSESLELLDFLSGSRAPDDHVVSKRVSTENGSGSGVSVSPTQRSVSKQVSALLHRLADPSTRWAAHLTLVEVLKLLPTWEQRGSLGEGGGVVAVLILSISKREGGERFIRPSGP
jgi:hypothetical protein